MIDREAAQEKTLTVLLGIFALPTLGYSDALPPTITSIPGLSIVNSAHIVNGTLNVNETIGLADRMLPALMADAARSPGVPSLQPERRP